MICLCMENNLQDEQVVIRAQKLLEMQKAGNDPFSVTTYVKSHHSTQVDESMMGKTVSVAGRIVLMRVMGKASFAHLLDEFGKIQIYINSEVCNYEDFKKFDLGDIVGVSGTVFKTKTGEISVHVSELQLLAKALTPLPDKHGGLKDPELRYRERHADLICNPEVREIFKIRTKVITAIRELLDGEGFLEVETPILQTIAGGAEARPFVTHHNALNMKMYLRIATELHLKRLIVGGFERVYEIGRIFRNEGISYKHNPEFTSMELYQAYTDYHGMADICERIFKHVLKRTNKPEVIDYQGTKINFGGKYRRVRMVDIVKEFTGLDFNKLDAKTAAVEMKKAKIEIPKNKTWGELLYSCFEQRVEDKLIDPTFIMEYPIEISPLAKKKPGDDRLTERFEFFVAGREMANAFSELNDPLDQRARFEQQMKEREKGNDEAHQMDEEFLSALGYGMPPTGGIGIGLDRLIMLVANVHSIRESLLFPTMKPRA